MERTESEVPGGPHSGGSPWSPTTSLFYPNRLICYSDASLGFLTSRTSFDIYYFCLPEIILPSPANQTLISWTGGTTCPALSA